MGIFSRVAAQLNPFDHGKTYQNPQPKPQPKPPARVNAQALMQALHEDQQRRFAQAGKPQAHPAVRQTLHHASILHDLTHNPVTNFAGAAAQFIPQASENYSNTFANLGNRLGGGKNQTIQQNMGGSKLLDKTLKLSGATGKNKQLAGDVAQIGLSALPGVGKGAGLAAKAATGAGVGGGFNAASTFGNGGNAKQIAKAGALGAGVGAVLPIAGAGVKPAIKGVSKVVDKRVPLNQAGAVGRNVNHAEVAKKYFTNKSKATADYQAHTMAEFGVNKPNIVSADSAKFIVGGGKMNPEHSVPYHDEASKFSKDYYKQLLADPKTKHQDVMFTGGGSGAGKTYALRSAEGGHLNQHAAIVDTNLTDVPGSVKKIDQALKSGRNVKINYVYRDPVQAFTHGVLPRAGKTGRTVPIDIHTGTHVGSVDTIQKLAEHYKGDPGVKISVIHNSPKGVSEVPLDFLKDKRYNEGELKKVLSNELEQAHQQGKISPETYHASKSGIQSSDGFPSKGPTEGLEKPAQVATADNALATRPTAQLSDKAALAPQPQLVEQASLPHNTPLVAPNSLTAGAERQNVSPAVQAGVTGEHVVRNTKQLQAQAVAQTAKTETDQLINQAHEAMAVAPGKIDDHTVAFVDQAIQRADAEGRTREAIDLHDSLSEHLVKNGQTSQAASLLYRLSPEGQFYKGIRDIKKGGGKLSPKVEQDLRDLTDQIKKAPDPELKEQLTAEFHKRVADALPKSAADKALSIWKAGLLSGVKTQGGNFASNATFATLKGVSNPLAATIDRGLSLLTGQRTKTLTYKGIGYGTKEGTRKGVGTLRTGIDSRNLGGSKYEIHGELNFKNPIINKLVGTPTNLVFRGMSAADQPFYFAALRNNLEDLAKADGLTRGLHGGKLSTHVDELVHNPTVQMTEQANLAAQKAVLGQDSAIASAVSKFARTIPGGQVVIPFVKVPTNFLSRTLDYTPIGAIKTATQQIRARHLDQRVLSEAIAESATGSGLIYLGAELANNNMLSGQYPTSDQKEAARWKAEGIQPNSVKIGKTWVGLNYLGPVGLLFGAGKDAHDAAVRGDNATLASAAGLGKNLTGQSFLTGLSGFANALQDPGRYGQNLINSEAGSVVPSVANDVANLGDNYQRESNNPLQAIKSRTPVARNSLPIKEDVYGNDLKQRSSKGNVLANPLRPSDAITNDVKTEVARLHNADVNNTDLQVTPTPVGKTVKVEGKTVKLSDSQRHDLQKAVGQSTQANWGLLIKTPEYQALDDAGKAKALGNLRTDSTTLAQRQYVLDNNLGTYNKAVTARQASLGQGTSIADYAKPKAAKTPKIKTSRAKGVRVSSGSRKSTASVAKLKLGRLPSVKSVSLSKIRIGKSKSGKSKKSAKIAFKHYSGGTASHKKVKISGVA